VWPSNELMTGVFVGQIIVIKCVGVASFLSVYSDVNVFDIRMNTFDVLSRKMIHRCYNYKAFMACAFGL
jgi:hypothetical protein